MGRKCLRVEYIVIILKINVTRLYYHENFAEPIRMLPEGKKKLKNDQPSFKFHLFDFLKQFVVLKQRMTCLYPSDDPEVTAKNLRSTISLNGTFCSSLDSNIIVISPEIRAFACFTFQKRSTFLTCGVFISTLSAKPNQVMKVEEGTTTHSPPINLVLLLKRWQSLLQEIYTYDVLALHVTLQRSRKPFSVYRYQTVRRCSRYTTRLAVGMLRSEILYLHGCLHV